MNAANGSVRQRLHDYAAGRHDPVGPLGEREYLVSMDRYQGFVYHELIGQLLASPKIAGPGTQVTKNAPSVTPDTGVAAMSLFT